MLFAPPMTTFAILVGGRLTVTDRVLRQIDSARVIAADSGIAHAQALGVTPELWVGDFDSASLEDIEHWRDVPRMGFPPDKDSTDGDLALSLALERGATSIVVVGAFGGSRSDHAFVHLTVAWRLAETGIPVRLTSGHEEGLPIVGGLISPQLAPGTVFSVLAFTDLKGLSISGAKWPLTNRDVPFGSTLTLSNVADGDVVITLDEGRAFLVFHPDA